MDTGSGSASYIDIGGQGRPALYVHGVGTSSYLWRHMIDQDFSLPGLARFVTDFRDALHLTDVDHRVANDTGGAIAKRPIVVLEDTESERSDCGAPKEAELHRSTGTLSPLGYETERRCEQQARPSPAARHGEDGAENERRRCRKRRGYEANRPRPAWIGDFGDIHYVDSTVAWLSTHGANSRRSNG